MKLRLKQMLSRMRLPKARLPTADKIEPILRPICLAGGLFMLGRGLYLIYEPAMWLAVGLILIWAGIPPRPRR